MHSKIGLAVYLPHQWSRLLATAEDANTLESSWEEWHHVFKKTKGQFIMQGLDVVEVTIDLDVFAAYCQRNGLKNNGASRAKYVTDYLSQIDNN